MNSERSDKLRQCLERSAVLPIVTLDDATQAVPLARALAAGGVSIVEVTLRTPDSLEAIRRIAGEVEGVLVGAGTVRSPAQIGQAVAAGARFLVSPGLSPELKRAAALSPVPFLPGVSTVSEAMSAAEAGFGILKFFPAEPAGGVETLRAFAGPLPDIAFCPTGGISAEMVASYIALPNVVCVGGSWLAPSDALRLKDWARITALADSVRKRPAA